MARAARLVLGPDAFAAGARAAAGSIDKYLDCASSSVQKTVRRCQLKPTSAAFARHFGRKVEGATMNVHYQGDVVNMFVEYAAGVSFEQVYGDVKSELGPETKFEAWADDARLYQDLIWISSDQLAEVSISRTVKGAPGGKTRIFVSSIKGSRPIHPDDLQGKD